MPSTGTPRPRRTGFSAGARGAYTDAGPPDRMIAAGRRLARYSGLTSYGTISEYTWHSRTRRAISWAYCAPKSTTKTGRGSSVTPILRSPHPQALASLKVLPLGPDGGRHDDLRLLELLDVRVAARGHGHLQCAEQVERPVVLVGRPDQDLLQRPDLLRANPRSPRKLRMERGHAPVETLPGCFVRPGKRGPDHDRVGAAGDGLGDIAAGAHPSVRDDVGIPAGLVEVLHPGGGGIRDRRGLGNADPDDPPSGAGRPRPHTHQDAHRSGTHQVQRGRVRRAPADDHRDLEPGDEFLQVKRLGSGGDVLGRDHRSLDHQDVQLGPENQVGKLTNPLRRERSRGHHPAFSDLSDPPLDEFLLDGLPIELLHAPGGL